LKLSLCLRRRRYCPKIEIVDCGLSVNHLDRFFPAFSLLTFELGCPSLSQSVISALIWKYPPSPSSLFSKGLDTSFNQALRHLSIDAVDSLSSQQDLSSRTEFIRTEVQKRTLAMADPESPTLPLAARLPKFEMAREYDGKSSAARWLTKLGYDFEQSGQVPPSPSLYLKAIDMLFVGDAATWLDRTLQMRYIVNNKATATAADVKEFEDAMKEHFPAALTTVPEISAQAQMDTLTQEASEPHAAYYQRAVNILQRTHGRDRPRTTESFCGSLWLSYDIVLQTQKAIQEKKLVEEQLPECKKLSRLEEWCQHLTNRSASSLLSNLDDLTKGIRFIMSQAAAVSSSRLV